MKVAILTGGRSGELILRYLKQDPSVSKIDVYDDVIDSISVEPISGKLATFEPTDEHIIIATGIMWFRRKLWEKYKNFPFINIVRSNMPDQIGKGNILFPTVFFEWFSKIGDNNVISAGTIVNHHCIIGDGNLLGPGCFLSGSVTIGNNCTIGSGVIIQPWVKIEDETTIPSGTIVVGDLKGGIIAKRKGSIYTGEYLHSLNRK
jgi:hypothetical protein